MSDRYQPPSSQGGFIALGAALTVALLIACFAVLFVSSGFMHGD